MLIGMTTASDPFLPPLSDLVNSAQHALLYECIPPLPDTAGRICVVCDTFTGKDDTVPSPFPDGHAELLPSGELHTCRRTQLLGVGLLSSPQTWLQHLAELPESRNYPSAGAGPVYVIAWDSLGSSAIHTPDAHTVLKASLDVLETHPLLIGGGVACSVAGYHWVTEPSAFGDDLVDPTTSNSSPDQSLMTSQVGLHELQAQRHAAGEPTDLESQTSADIGEQCAFHDGAAVSVGAKQWWRAAQRVAQSERAWVSDAWDSWKLFLGVVSESERDTRTSTLFTSWTVAGQPQDRLIPPAGDAALMVASLDDPALRDAVLLAGALPSTDDHVGLLDHLVGSGDVDRLANLLTSIFRGTQPPEWTQIAKSQARVVALCRSAPPGYRARCLAMVAWWAWFAGDVGRARQVAAAACLDDASVRLAQLVTQACEFQVWPGWRRNRRQAS